MPSVFAYNDYRKFLSDYYSEKKALSVWFSYLNFSRKAGFARKSFVFNVIGGRRELSRASVVKMCAALARTLQSGVLVDEARAAPHVQGSVGRLSLE